MELYDKNAVMQVFGSLMKRPLLLAEVDKYHLEVRDFKDKVHRSIFAAINNLYLNGAQNISEIDIDNYLSSYGDLKVEFDRYNGIAYLQDCLDLSDEGNFLYYYKRLKKFSALRQLQKDGFNISSFYCEDTLDRRYNEILESFDRCEISDFFDEIKKKIAGVESLYTTGRNNESQDAANGLTAMKEQFKNAPDIGLPLQGDIYNTVLKGARLGKYYLRSSGTNTGKTRCAVGDACNLAFPIWYDWTIDKWVNSCIAQKVLFITTEMEADEIQTMILAWVSGVNEENILTGRYGAGQEKVVDEAIKVIERYKDNFIIDHIADPTIGQIETCVRKHCLLENVQYVFYDYLFSSPSLLREFSDTKIRQDGCNITSCYIPFPFISGVKI